MKKRIALILSMLCLIVLVVALSSCGHEHAADEKWSQDDANHWQACTGGDDCADQLNKAAHTFVKVDQVNPTCTATGSYVEECSVCKYRKPAVTVPVVAHNYADATCTAPKTCACGATEGEALGHDWVDATCSAPKTCSACFTTDGVALPHTWVDATCTAPKTCSVCTATEGNALGHNEQYEIIEPTCLVGGITNVTCSRCDYVNTKDPTEARGHNYQYDIVPPTCVEDGYTAVTCSECDYSATENPVPSSGTHNWQDATCTVAKKCSACGLEEGNALGHETSTVVVDPTCTEAGKTVLRCSRCDFETPLPMQGEPAKGHKYDFEGDSFVVVEDPTCTTPGVKYYTCTVCGETPADDGNDVEIEALGHDEQLNVIDPTCTLGGITEVECSRCDLFETRNPTDPTGHTYYIADDAEQGTHYIVSVDPTCTEEGERRYYCTACKVLAEEEKGKTAIAPLGHDMQVVVAPWCGNDGITERACSRTCRDVKCEVVDTLDATEVFKHSYPADVKVPATCVDNAIYDCAECGREFVAYEGDEVGQATGKHEYTDIVEIIIATCVDKGYTIYGCSAGNCGTTQNGDVTDIVDHQLGEVTVYGTVSCVMCNKTYVDVTAEKVAGGDKICVGCGNDPCTCEGISADWEGYISPDAPFDIQPDVAFTITEVEWSDSVNPLQIGRGIIVLGSQDTFASYTVSIFDGETELYTFTVSGDSVIIDLSEYESVTKVVITATSAATASFYSLI